MVNQSISYILYNRRLSCELRLSTYITIPIFLSIHQFISPKFSRYLSLGSPIGNLHLDTNPLGTNTMPPLLPRRPMLPLRTPPSPGALYLPVRALNIDPSPSPKSSPHPSPSSTDAKTSPAGPASTDPKGATKEAAYGKEGTNSGEYGNEDVEAAIKSAEMPKPQEMRR